MKTVSPRWSNYLDGPLGALSPLLVWGVFFLFVYVAVALTCARPPEPGWIRPLLWFAGMVALLATLLLGAHFARQLRRNAGDGERRALLRIGFYLSIISLIAIAWTALPTLFIRPCA